MSIACDKCKDEGTEQRPVFYIESYLRGVPMLEAVRDLRILEDPQMNPWDPYTTPCTLHLHSSCAQELQIIITQKIQEFIEPPPKEKPSDKKKKSAKAKDPGTDQT